MNTWRAGCSGSCTSGSEGGPQKPTRRKPDRALRSDPYTGVRRSELLGLRWTDLDADLARLSINRGLVAVGYELHESRGKTDHSRRCIDLDDTTLSVLAGWRALQAAECAAVGVNNPGWMFTTAVGAPMHLHAISQTFERIVRRTAIPVIRLHDLRHPRQSAHRRRRARQGGRRRTWPRLVRVHRRDLQHVLPGMQADAARVIEALIAPRPPSNPR